MSERSDFKEAVAAVLVTEAPPAGARKWLKAWPESRVDGFTNTPPSLDVIHRDGVRKRGLRTMLFGAALGVACAVSLGGCESLADEFEPLEQGEWLVCNTLRE